jgi:hypothetical protein
LITAVIALSSDTLPRGSRLKRKVPWKTSASCGRHISRSRTVLRGIFAMSMPSIEMLPALGSRSRRRVDSKMLLPLEL